MIDAETILAMLEQKCEQCENGFSLGPGSVVVVIDDKPIYHRVPCPVCGGTRKVLTDLGREVIGFVQRHISTVTR